MYTMYIKTLVVRKVIKFSEFGVQIHIHGLVLEETPTLV